MFYTKVTTTIFANIRTDPWKFCSIQTHKIWIFSQVQSILQQNTSILLMIARR